MKDLDQFVLHEIAFSPDFAIVGGKECCVVPRDLLQRVARDFDLADVRDAIRGKPGR